MIVLLGKFKGCILIETQLWFVANETDFMSLRSKGWIMLMRKG